MTERTVLILYGSETGNAQDMAEDLGKMCQRLHFDARVDEMDTVDLSQLLRYQLVIFALSTTGQGDMPHNALLFWKKMLRKRLPPGCLDQLRYTCIGLGDSTYVKFNWAARKLIRRLEQLGASTFLEPCEADEQFPEGIEGSFVQWADELRKHLLANCPGPEPIPEDVPLPSRWSLQPALDNKTPGKPPDVDDSPPLEHLPVPDGLTATLVENRRMTPDTHWQDVRLVAFEVDETLAANPGDCLTIHPKNFPQDVQRLISLMEWDSIADEVLDLSTCNLPAFLHTPIPCSLRSLLLHNIDITAVPRRSFLKSISFFSNNVDHRERLLEFTMKEFLDEYFDYATRSRRTIIEVLEEFDSVRVPAERILDVFPLIRGRDFSIANGGIHLQHPHRKDTTRIELLVALVKYRTILRKPRQGLCSRYLASLPNGTTLCVSIKRAISPIHGAVNAQRPLIAMATGTGIAPVRALLQERAAHGTSAPALLFFGNRNRSADYFFADEWNATRRLTIFPAFSRDQREKIYVQDLVRHEAPRLADLLQQKPIFAVCGGSSKMADACKYAVSAPLDGDAELQKLLESSTWWQEIW